MPPDSPVPVGGAGGSRAGVFPAPAAVRDVGGEPGASADHHRPAPQQPARRRGGVVYVVVAHRWVLALLVCLFLILGGYLFDNKKIYSSEPLILSE